MHQFWIIGGGQFGIRAAKILCHIYKKPIILVIDNNCEQLKLFKDLPVQTVCEDGIWYLYKNLYESNGCDWIIPSVPKHLAFEYICLKLMQNYDINSINIPNALDSILPNPIRGKQGRLLMSNADFICPENCSEPYEICSYTRKPRPGILYEVIEKIKLPDFSSIVIRSQQLAAGLGGYPPQALENAIEQMIKAHKNILFSTACFCHGVMDAFKINLKKK